MRHLTVSRPNGEYNAVSFWSNDAFRAGILDGGDDLEPGLVFFAEITVGELEEPEVELEWSNYRRDYEVTITYGPALSTLAPENK